MSDQIDELRVLACQVEIPATPDAAARNIHVATLCNRIGEVVAEAEVMPDMIVLPELSTIEYSDFAFNRLEELAEPLDGPSHREFSELARKTGATVVYGFVRQSENGASICQAAVAPDGNLRGYYDKLHLAQFGASFEARAFKPGNHLFCFKIKGLKIALLICYDIRFPGLTARLAHEGVDVILQCSAYARDLSFHSWRHFVVTRSMENGLAWLGLNRAGPNWGGSIWCPGYADSEYPEEIFGTKEEFRFFSLPVDFREQVADRLPFIRDRRNDYAILPIQSTPKEVKS